MEDGWAGDLNPFLSFDPVFGNLRRMKTAHTITKWLNVSVAGWMANVAERACRISLGVIFIWFGALKPLGISPAADLVAATVPFFPPEIFIPVLGIWEVLIGVFFLFRKTTWWAIVLMVLQMPGTFLPLVLLPDQCFTAFPYGLTLEGQYIIKNLALIAVALFIGGAMQRRAFETARVA